MFTTLPPSPAELLTQTHLVALGAAGIVVGFALVLCGYKLARLVVVLAGAGVGFAIASPLAERIGARLDVTRGVMVFCLATVSFVTARMIWAAVGAATLACIVAAVVVACLAPGTFAGPQDASPADAGQWAWDYGDHVWAAMETALSRHGLLLYAGMGVAAGVMLLLGMLWPRHVQIAVTALLGAVLLPASGLLLAAEFKPDLWNLAMAKPWHVPAIFGGRALISLIVQAWQAAGAAKSDSDPAAS